MNLYNEIKRNSLKESIGSAKKDFIKEFKQKTGIQDFSVEPYVIRSEDDLIKCRDALYYLVDISNKINRNVSEVRGYVDRNDVGLWFNIHGGKDIATDYVTYLCTNPYSTDRYCKVIIHTYAIADIIMRNNGLDEESLEDTMYDEFKIRESIYNDLEKLFDADKFEYGFVCYTEEEVFDLLKTIDDFIANYKIDIK